MNIYLFAMPVPAYGNPLIMGGKEIHNLGTWVFTHIVADHVAAAYKSMVVKAFSLRAGGVVVAFADLR